MTRTRRLLAAIAGVFGFTTLASAGPITWNYQIRTDWAPSRILAEEKGVTDTAVTIQGLLQRPTLRDPLGMPDPTTYRYDTFDWTNTYQLEVRFTDVKSWTHNYDEFGWAIRREWVKTPDGLGWDLHDTTEYLYPDPEGVSYNYAGGNRYEVRLTADADIVLSVTPNVPNPYDQPEPGTLILAGIGVAGVGLMRLQRRRATIRPGT
jgi:hypothetical protein